MSDFLTPDLHFERTRAAKAVVAAAAALAGLILADLPFRAQEANPLARLSEAVRSLAQRVSPAVVQVVVASRSYGLGGPGGSLLADLGEREKGFGAGVLVSEDGFVLTNAHVVAGAMKVLVVSRAAGSEGREVREAQIVGVSQDLDMALLKIPGTGYPVLPFADESSPQQGDLVFAFGSPEGLENSITHGVVSAVNRQVDAGKEEVYVQTDAPINPGNSGGPLVDGEGRIVGISTFIYSESGGSEGLGFAVPGHTAKFAYEELKRYGRIHRYGVGADVQTLTPVLARGLGFARDEGLVICDVWPGGPAAAAGLRPGDLIVALDGTKVSDMGRYLAFFQRDPGGGSARVTFKRGTQIRTVEVPIQARREAVDWLEERAEGGVRIPLLGIVSVDVTPKVREWLPGLRSEKGALVAARITGPVEGSSELEAGDVVAGLNGERVDSAQGLSRALSLLKAGAPVVLQVERDGRFFYLSFQME
jgi:serine protease Do